MIKKILTLIACLFFSVPVFAETYFRISDTNVLSVSVKRYFSTLEQQESVLQKYRDLLTKNQNMGLLAADMWDVCMAGGLDISQPTDKQNCTQFVSSLVSFGDAVFYPVCKSKDEIPSDVREKSKCESDFFNWTNVQQASAVALAKLYATEKYNDEIMCSTKYRQAGNDDFIQCKSLNTGAFYEFKFDDIRESVDSDIQTSIVKAVCGIYGAIQLGTTTMSKTQCKATEEQCLKVQAAYKTLVDSAEINYLSANGMCEINFGLIKEAKDLKRACNIDPFTFCRGTQFNTNLEFLEALKEYTAKQCQTEMFNIHCDSSFKTYMGPGCKVSSNAPKDDIVSCYFGDQQIDYVFDDVNELSKKRANAGMQSMSCILLDGTFDGKNCVGLNEDECKYLEAQNNVDCPDCKGIRWDEKNELCILPDAKNLTNGEKVLKIAGVTGAVVVAVASSIVSAGAAAPGAWAVVAKIGTGLVIAGGVTKITAEAVESFGIFEPFVEKANQCLIDATSECAEELLINELNKMQSYSKDFQVAEARAVDDIFVKLINQLDDDSKFWTEFYSNPEFFDCQTKDGNEVCTVKESEQFWQAISRVGNTMIMVGGIVNIIGNVGGALSATKSALHTRVVNGKYGARLAKSMTNKTPLTGNVLRSLGFEGGRSINAQLVSQYGLKVGQQVWLAQGGRLITNASIAKALGAGAVAVTIGAGGELLASEDTDFSISRPVKSTPDSDPAVASQPEVPEVVPEEPEVPVVALTPDSAVTSTPGSAVASLPEVPVIDSTPDNRTITPYNVKKPKTGLIATAAVLGTVGTGFLVGGLLNRDKNDDAAQQNVITGSTVENEINTMLNNANSVIGVVGESQITLVPMATTVNTMSPIVNINNNAVVVVNYRGHKLPFYLGGVSWTPLLGIGQTGGWFNTYLTNPAPTYITQIQAMLNQKLTPTMVQKYTGVNATGVQLPFAAPAAYSVINAEFTDGVVQTYTGALSGSDKTLHDNNYNKIKAIK